MSIWSSILTIICIVMASYAFSDMLAATGAWNRFWMVARFLMWVFFAIVI